MKRWNVIVELPAQQDIAEARLWLAGHNPDAADRWFNSIYDTIGSLEIFPERSPLAPESKNLNTRFAKSFTVAASTNTASFSLWPKSQFTSDS